MLPLRDTVPCRRLPWVVRALVLANLVAFGLELSQGRALPGLMYHFGVVPAQWLVSSPSDLLGWPTLFLALLTSQFLHGGILHLASNMLSLWIFGRAVEDRLGPRRFLALYLGSGVAAAVTHLLTAQHSAVPMVGSSGAVAGLLGAYLLLCPSARVVTVVPLGFFWDVREIPAPWFLGAWFLFQWWRGVMGIGRLGEVGGIAFWAHIGGLVAGMVGVVIWQARQHESRSVFGGGPELAKRPGGSRGRSGSSLARQGED